MKKLISLLLAALMMFGLTIAVSAEGYSGLNGNGTSSSPYQISGIDDWETFVNAVNADSSHGEGLYFKLTGDVGSDGNETISYVEEFWGSFNGNGKTVWISLDRNSLFSVNYGSIKNLCVRGSLSFSAAVPCGGICGTNYGTVDHCANYASLSSFFYIGGICGKNEKTVVNCINYGPIEGDGYIGGICGLNGNSSALILNCVNAGTVTGQGYTAGICGYVKAYTSNTPSGIILCANCGLPTQGAGGHYALLTCYTRGFHPELAWECYFVNPVKGVYCVASSDEGHDIIAKTKQSFADFLGAFNGHKVAEKEGERIANSYALTEWAIGNDGLPVFAGPRNQASVLSKGYPEIVYVIGGLAVAAVVVLVIVKKKKPTAANTEK